MRELVEAKLEGGEEFTAEEEAPRWDDTEDVSDLLAKLEASVRRRREEREDIARERVTRPRRCDIATAT